MKCLNCKFNWHNYYCSLWNTVIGNGDKTINNTGKENGCMKIHFDTMVTKAKIENRSLKIYDIETHLIMNC